MSDEEWVDDEKLDLPVVEATERETPSACDVPCDSVWLSEVVSATELVVEEEELLERDVETMEWAGVVDQEDPSECPIWAVTELEAPSDTPVDAPDDSCAPDDSVCPKVSLTLSFTPPLTTPMPPPAW